MQRIKSILAVTAFCVCMVSCAGLNDKRQIPSVTSIVQIDRTGKPSATWKPIPGSVYVFNSDDHVEFIDSITGKKQKVTGSYKLKKTR